MLFTLRAAEVSQVKQLLMESFSLPERDNTLEADSLLKKKRALGILGTFDKILILKVC